MRICQKRSETHTFKAIKQYYKYHQKSSQFHSLVIQTSPVPSNTFHSPKQLPKRSWLTAPKSMVRDFNRVVIMTFLAHCIMKVRELVVEITNQSLNTLPKTNIAPTNGWLEYYFPIGEAYFQGLR